MFIETNFTYTNVETDYWTIIPKVIWISKSKISKPIFDAAGTRIDQIIGSTIGLHLTQRITICLNTRL